MLVPGLTFSASGRVLVSAGLVKVPDFINQGLGFMNDGRLALEEGPILGNERYAGFPVSPLGAIYIIDSGLSVVAGYIQGLAFHTDGRLIVAIGDPDQFVNGNPFNTAFPGMSISP